MKNIFFFPSPSHSFPESNAFCANGNQVLFAYCLALLFLLFSHTLYCILRYNIYGCNFHVDCTAPAWRDTKLLFMNKQGCGRDLLIWEGGIFQTSICNNGFWSWIQSDQQRCQDDVTGIKSTPYKKNPFNSVLIGNQASLLEGHDTTASHEDHSVISAFPP